jgi:hypothetical protein
MCNKRRDRGIAGRCVGARDLEMGRGYVGNVTSTQLNIIPIATITQQYTSTLTPQTSSPAATPP